MTRRLSRSEPFAQSGKTIKFRDEESAEMAFHLLFACLEQPETPLSPINIAGAGRRFRDAAFRSVGAWL